MRRQGPELREPGFSTLSGSCRPGSARKEAPTADLRGTVEASFSGPIVNNLRTHMDKQGEAAERLFWEAVDLPRDRRSAFLPRTKDARRENLGLWSALKQSRSAPHHLPDADE
jgi:hypothetical protein